MKILELLNKFFLFFFLLIIFNTYSLHGEEPVDIWKIEKEKKINKDKKSNSEQTEINENSIYSLQENKEKNSDIISYETANSEKVKLAGIFDPEENNLSLGMWTNSKGEEIKSLLKKINQIDLSEDSKEIFNIAILTNSYFPNNGISPEEFIEFKIEYLIKTENLDLIKLYLSKNKDLYNNEKLVRFYVDQYLSNSELENACNIFEIIKNISNNYLSKFQIYCLYNFKGKNEAQLLFDIKKELGFNDKYFEDKFNFLMGYKVNNKKEISEKNILDFHLSHRTNKNFLYTPNEKTSKIIWKYLSTSNLLENTSSVDIENSEKIGLIEKATQDKNYKEKDLLELYKRFQFNINQLLNVQEASKLLPPYKARALFYQKLLLTSDSEEKLFILSNLKKLFVKDNIEDAFNTELANFLNEINLDEVSSEYTSFYKKYSTIEDKKDYKIKFNNKIIHQSKLLNYFIENKEKSKIEKEANDLLKKIKKNKKYYFTTKDLILLESLKSDGVEFEKKNKNLYEINEPNIPIDIQRMTNNQELGLVLLRLVEVIGEDSLEDLGTESLYFMINILNETNLDTIRNRIILKVLPLKI